MKIKTNLVENQNEKPTQTQKETNQAEVSEEIIPHSDSGGDFFEDDLEEETPPESLDPIAQIEVTECTTPAGNKAITFISPISNLKVMVLNPSNRRLSGIAKDVAKHKALQDPIMQMALFLSHLVCEYGNKSGERCLTVNYILDIQDPKETRCLAMIINNFFRLDSF